MLHVSQANRGSKGSSQDLSTSPEAFTAQGLLKTALLGYFTPAQRAAFEADPDRTYGVTSKPYIFYDPVDGTDLNVRYAGQAITGAVMRHLSKRLVRATRKYHGLSSNSTYAVEKLRQQYDPAAGREYRRKWIANWRSTRE